MRPILILGLGNPLQGDDGVGCSVAMALEQYKLPEDVEVIDGGTPGVGLINLIEGRKFVVIIDAAEMGVAPGQFKRFQPEQVLLTGSQERFSLHRSGVADALALAHKLNMKLAKIVFFGVQPERVGWGEKLSPSVQAAIPHLIEAVLNEAGAYNGKRENSDY